MGDDFDVSPRTADDRAECRHRLCHSIIRYWVALAHPEASPSRLT